MKLSVICATYNRAALLDNALYTYSRQTLPCDQWEYLLADDGSTDKTVEVVKKWQAKGLPVRLYDAAGDLGLPKEPGRWRDGCRLRNAVSTFAFGEVLVATHPEIMIPAEALDTMYSTVQRNPEAWVTAVPYWLPDGVLPSFKRDLANLKTMPGFYDPSWPGPASGIDYRNQNQEVRTTWESEVFWAMSMARWRWLGGFREFEVWGSVDMDFLGRRRAAGTPTVIARSITALTPPGNLMVYHQFHAESPRDMAKAMAAMSGQDYGTVEGMRRQGGLYANYATGPREREVEGGHQVLADHVARYRFAAAFCHGMKVLDIPCGTGYGYDHIRQAGPAGYIGMDADAECVTWANRYGGDFRVGLMERTGLPDGSVTQIVCFEGLEHTEHHRESIAEFRRVLAPGGRFIISTPQKGVAPGTPWDRHMLAKEELLEAVTAAGFTRLDWFRQHRYGDSPVLPGEPGPDDHIMILGGTRPEER